jgi:hypothetical protein
MYAEMEGRSLMVGVTEEHCRWFREHWAQYRGKT